MAHTHEFLTLLRQVIDPEVGLNIVDMGLVYSVTQDENGLVTVTMTLTTPGCPMGPHILGEVESVLEHQPEVREVKIDLVWDPPWTPEKIKPEALEELHRR